MTDGINTNPLSRPFDPGVNYNATTDEYSQICWQCGQAPWEHDKNANLGAVAE